MSNLKLAFIDTETTGVDPKVNDIWQLGVILDIDGQEVARELFECKPFNMAAVSPEALAVSGVTMEYLEKLQQPYQMFYSLRNLLSKYVNKYDKNDNFKIVAFNTPFDKDFLYNFFSKCGDSYFHSLFAKPFVDLLNFFRIPYCLEQFNPMPANLKLQTLTEYFSITHDQAHNALSDASAVRDIWYKHVSFYFNCVYYSKV